MIFKTPLFFFLLLGLLTLLGASIGYCIAAIRERRLAKNTIETMQLKMAQERRASLTELSAARVTIQRLQDAKNKAEVTAKRASLAAKSNAPDNAPSNHHFELRRAKPVGYAQLPTLSKRVPNSPKTGNSKPAVTSPVHSRSGGKAALGSKSLKLSLPGELEIPKLSESELLSDLEPEVNDMDGDETGKHG